MYIDCDTHYWPVEFLDRVDHPDKGRIEHDDDGWVSFYRDGAFIHRFNSGRWDLEKRKQAMDLDGFDIQVLIPDNRPFLYKSDPDLGRAMATNFNDFVADEIKGEDRFIGVSWVFLPDMKVAIKELERAKKMGLGTVKLTGGYDDLDLDHPSMWPLYEAAEDLGIPLLIHGAGREYDDQVAHPWLIGADRMGGMRFLATCLGFTFTYIHSITRLILSGTLDRFPRLKFAFFEGGVGWVPFLLAQLDNEATHRGYAAYQKDNNFTLERKPSEYFDRLYIAATSYEPYIADVAKNWPNHRIVIGSDFDHRDPIATWPDTVNRIQANTELSVTDKEKILGGNARDLFDMVEVDA